MPASGAVRLAADSRPIAGRSTQPDQKRFKRPLLNCYDDSPGRIIQTNRPVSRTTFQRDCVAR